MNILHAFFGFILFLIKDLTEFVFWLLLAGFAILALVRYIYGKFKVSGLEQKSVLISGCDSGFGRLLVHRLQERGVRVFAGCHTEQGEAELRKEFGVKSGLETFHLDITKQKSIDHAFEFVQGKLNGEGPWGLVNNAGVLDALGWDDFLTPDDYVHLFEVNALGTIRMTHTFKPLVKKARGRIVNTSSVGGRASLIGLAAYNVSKYGVEAYSDTIRLELTSFGVSVHIVEPGLFLTPLTQTDRVMAEYEKTWKRADESVRQEYGANFLEKMQSEWLTYEKSSMSYRPEQVAEAYEHALFSVCPKNRYCVGWAAAVWLPFSMLPASVQDPLLSGLTMIKSYKRDRDEVAAKKEF